MSKLKYFPVVQELSAWVKEALDAGGLKQVDLMNKVKTNQSFISGLVRGKMKLIETEKWKAIRSVFNEHGQVCPDDIDPEKIMPDSKAIFSRYMEIKKATNASWEIIAGGAGVHTTTLQNFMSKKSVRCETLVLLQRGLKKYEELPTKIVEQKLVSSKKPSAKTSLIEVMPAKTGLPSELELDLRELELITRLRLHHSHSIPAGLNGAARVR
jgi:hypothetical protein